MSRPPSQEGREPQFIRSLDISFYDGRELFWEESWIQVPDTHTREVSGDQPQLPDQAYDWDDDGALAFALNDFLDGMCELTLGAADNSGNRPPALDSQSRRKLARIGIALSFLTDTPWSYNDPASYYRKALLTVLEDDGPSEPQC